jgi:hypothetical protein
MAQSKYNGLIRNPAAPNLPIAPVEYSQSYTDQLSNALRLYFTGLDNINQVTTQRITAAGIAYPDNTIQTSAYVAGSIEAYDRSASIAVTATPTLLIPANYINANNVTYNNTNGVFTFQYSGNFSFALSVNAVASSAGQSVYIYAQSNVGSVWTNIANSGKSYQLVNGQHTQILYPGSVVRTAGQQIRYYIYSNGSKVNLVTDTLPGVTPNVYIAAIRIQYVG